MDDDTFENEETSFGKAVTQAFIISAAASAGTLIGFAVIGFTMSKLDKFKENRAAKNDTPIES